jgi:hypothetical protein
MIKQSLVDLENMLALLREKPEIMFASSLDRPDHTHTLLYLTTHECNQTAETFLAHRLSLLTKLLSSSATFPSRTMVRRRFWSVSVVLLRAQDSHMQSERPELFGAPGTHSGNCRPHWYACRHAEMTNLSCSRFWEEHNLAPSIPLVRPYKVSLRPHACITLNHTDPHTHTHTLTERSGSFHLQWRDSHRRPKYSALATEFCP